jgi:hypothetical protein
VTASEHELFFWRCAVMLIAFSGVGFATNSASAAKLQPLLYVANGGVNEADVYSYFSGGFIQEQQLPALAIR